MVVVWCPAILFVSGLGCEVMLTFMLVLVIFACTDEVTGGAGNLTPLAIGLTVATAHLMGVSGKKCT